jgi:hypothetical protein
MAWPPQPYPWLSNTCHTVAAQPFRLVFQVRCIWRWGELVRRNQRPLTKTQACDHLMLNTTGSLWNCVLPSNTVGHRLKCGLIYIQSIKSSKSLLLGLAKWGGWTLLLDDCVRSTCKALVGEGYNDFPSTTNLLTDVKFTRDFDVLGMPSCPHKILVGLIQDSTQITPMRVDCGFFRNTEEIATLGASISFGS